MIGLLGEKKVFKRLGFGCVVWRYLARPRGVLIDIVVVGEVFSEIEAVS